MYTSLDRIDAVESDGGKPVRYLLTDHRDAAEQGRDLNLSIVFALTRVLLCQRHARDQGLEVETRMTFVFGVHPRVAQAVVAAGGTVEVLTGEDPPPDAGAATDPWALLDASMAALARQVAEDERVTLDAAGLRRLEEELWPLGLDRDGSEVGYYTWLIKLAAFTGELLRAQSPGAWKPVGADMGSLPYSWVSDDGRVTNIVGRCERLFSQGPEQGPSVLLRIAADRHAPAGPILPNFKPTHFSRLGTVVHEPLLGKVESEDMVMVVYGEDRPNTFEYMAGGHPLAGDLVALRSRAVANLAGIEPQIDRIEKSGVTLVIASGHFYAAEKVLDRAFMRRIHRELGATMLFASMPAKGILILMEADPGNLTAFDAVTRLQFDKGKAHGRELSTLAFLVVDGEVAGLARVDRSPAPPNAPPDPSTVEPERRRRSLFSWLFGT